jgi:HSP20 family protein
MALVNWAPFEGLTSLRREMDQLFENFFERGHMGSTGTFEPAVEVADSHDHVTVKVQVPGVSKDNLQVNVAENALTLRGEMKEEEKTDGKQYYRQEFRYGTFARTIPLPPGLQADKAIAELKDGVLTITIPKGEQAKPKQIPIKA